MEIKPVIVKKPPEYPTEYLFINNPELFKRYIPLRWYKNKLVCTALSVFIVAGTTNSCTVAPKTAAELSEKSDKAKTLKEAKNKAVKVAPIFVHGNGSGATGCVVSSPPVFISESEAMEIIMDELREANIKFDTSNCPNIRFQAEAISDLQMDSQKKPEEANVNLKLDGINGQGNFVMEYISADDLSKFHSDNYGWASVSVYHSKKAAEFLSEALKKEAKYNAVVFYDPLPIMDFENEDNYDKFEIIQKQAKAEAKKLLVAQVQDFINWLKTEEITK